jgi:endonuclease/exonuclease/phosphatase family metal-dependent hydrolase
MKLRLVSINIWDLPVPLPGFARASRRRALLQQLTALDADLVLIQEAFLPAFKLQLAGTLATHQPDHYLEHSRRHLFLSMDASGGLATFSRFRLDSSRYGPFPLWRGMKPDERVGRKGCLWTQVQTPAGGLLIGNVHLYAGNTPRDTRARAMQTRHLLHRLARLPRQPTIVAGDFNMAAELEHRPDGRLTGFDLMRDAGFTEVAGGATGDLATMSPRNNRFARYAPWRRPERRLTQIFIRGDGLGLDDGPSLCLNQPPVSDHFGLLVTLNVP